MNKAQIHILDETQKDKVFVFQIRFNRNDTYKNSTNYTITNTGKFSGEVNLMIFQSEFFILFMIFDQ